MAKAKSVYVCSQCGYETPKWMGKCPGCGNWNCLEETVKAAPAPAVSSRVNVSRNAAVPDLVNVRSIDETDEIRFRTGLEELDRVLGGGIVKGSLVLLGGDPGIGKSTLLLQICQHLGERLSILYVSGEESARQLKLRANRDRKSVV